MPSSSEAWQKFGAINLQSDIDPETVTAYQKKKADMQEKINDLNEDITELKQKRKAVAHHIAVSEMSEEDRFRRLGTHSTTPH